MTNTKSTRVQLFANIATAVSAVIALFALIVTLWNHDSQSKQREITRWQNVVVAKILQEADGLTFREIKTRYVAEAQQLQTFDLPKSEIQDGVLYAILISLQSSQVAMLGNDRKYRARMSSPGPDMVSIWNEFQKRERERELFHQLRARVLSILEAESGNYTTDSLFRKLENEGMDVDYSLYSSTLNFMRTENVVIKDENDLLYATIDVPPSESAAEGDQ
jgi:hypothetical protein